VIACGCVKVDRDACIGIHKYMHSCSHVSRQVDIVCIKLYKIYTNANNSIVYHIKATCGI